jgi:hypothetical protein
MKRLAPALVAPLLIALLLITTSCGNNSQAATDKVKTCLGKIAVDVLESVAEHESPATLKNTLDVLPDCFEAAIAEFGPSSSATGSQVNILPASSEAVASNSVNSNTWNNCSDYTYQLQFNFDVYFKMVVGPPDARGTFYAPSDASSGADNDLIARSLFEQYSSTISSHAATSGHSMSFPLSVPPHTRVTLTLPIQLYYEYGTARLVNNGQSVYLPWFFTERAEQAGDITATTSSC